MKTKTKKQSLKNNSRPLPKSLSPNYLFNFLEGSMLELSDLDDFLCQGGDIHSRNEKGETLVHVASRQMDSEALNALLKAGARARVIDKNRQTPLHWAVFWNQESLLTPLLQAGANVNAQDEEGLSPLMKMVKLEGWNASSQQKKNRLEKNLIHLLKYPSFLDIADRQGWTALHHAAFSGHIRPAELLIENGATSALWDFNNTLPRDLIEMHHFGMLKDWLSMEERNQFQKLPMAKEAEISSRL